MICLIVTIDGFLFAPSRNRKKNSGSLLLSAVAQSVAVSVDTGGCSMRAAVLLPAVAREQEPEDRPHVLGREQRAKRGHRRAWAALAPRPLEPRRRPRRAEQCLPRAAARLM